jgi:CysZ protein
MSPIMALLSEKTDEIITGKKYPFVWDQFVRDVFRGIAIALRNMFIEFGFIIASFFLMWIPVIGWVMPIILLLISYYFYGFSMLDYTSERRKLKYRESIRYIRSNKGLAIGNGFIFSLLFSLPIFGGMIASVVAPVAATIAVIELEKKSDI